MSKSYQLDQSNRGGGEEVREEVRFLFLDMFVGMIMVRCNKVMAITRI